MTDRPDPLVRADAIRAAELAFNHPWNPLSAIHTTRIGAMAGLQRVAVSVARVPPGKESFVPHAHRVEEEWLYILAGTGTAIIDGVEHAVGPGDFMGFPAPQVVHHLRNTGTTDLVYLMGGETPPVDVVDFPGHGKRMVRVGERVEIADVDAFRPWPG